MLPFAKSEEQLPIDNRFVLDKKRGDVTREPGRPGDGWGGVEQRLDEIIVLLGRLAFQPKNAQILPRVYTIKLAQENINASLGLSKLANSITFLKPDASFTVKLQILINDTDVMMTESKRIPSGRDTKIDGCILSDIIYTNSAVVGATDVEVTTVWV